MSADGGVQSLQRRASIEDREAGTIGSALPAAAFKPCRNKQFAAPTWQSLLTAPTARPNSQDTRPSKTGAPRRSMPQFPTDLKRGHERWASLYSVAPQYRSSAA